MADEGLFEEECPEGLTLFKGDSKAGCDESSSGPAGSPLGSKKRGKYASISVSAMGVDVDKGPRTNLDEEGKSLLERDGEADAPPPQVKMRTKKGRGRQRQQQQQRKQKIRYHLPDGWERHEDELGPYFWHVRTGHIQREPPSEEEDSAMAEEAEAVVRDVRSSKIFDDDFDPLAASAAAVAAASGFRLSICGDDDDEINGKQMGSHSPDSKIQLEDKSKKIKAKLLGSVEVDEDDLTARNSSRAVNRCIVELNQDSSSSPAQATILELTGGSLKVTALDGGQVLLVQPVHAIKVWGVGRNNSKQFAYVAREKLSKKFLCHVFECEVPARSLANALRDNCKKVLIERNLPHAAVKALKPSEGDEATPDPERPSVQEPCKVIKAAFLGTVQVDKPCGIEVLHRAIDTLANNVPRAEWKSASLAVSPSTVTISHKDEDGDWKKIECRVRFLSFLGMGRDPRQAAFILHTAQNTFLAHIFHCEPSAGFLCKIIEAACKLRFQKCLDARPEGEQQQHGMVEEQREFSIASLNRHSLNLTSLKNALNNWRPWTATREPPA